MSRSLTRIECDFTGNPLATRPAGPVGSPSAWASWQFCGVPIAGGPGARPDKLGSGNPVPPRRTLLQTGLMALVCTLALGRTSTAGSLAARDMTPPPDVPDRATTPVRALSDPLVGVVRPDTRWTLRSGKRLHVFYVTVGLDDPNDDETSDDPGDDDDGWEGLNAFSETEVPVSALLQEIGSCQSEPETQSEPLWFVPPFFQVLPDAATAPLLALPHGPSPRRRPTSSTWLFRARRDASFIGLGSTDIAGLAA